MIFKIAVGVALGILLIGIVILVLLTIWILWTRKITMTRIITQKKTLICRKSTKTFRQNRWNKRSKKGSKTGLPRMTLKCRRRNKNGVDKNSRRSEFIERTDKCTGKRAEKEGLPDAADRSKEQRTGKEKCRSEKGQ